MDFENEKKIENLFPIFKSSSFCSVIGRSGCGKLKK